MMRALLMCGAAALLLAALGACADLGDSAQAPEGELEIQLAALGPALDRVIYSVTTSGQETVDVDSGEFAVTPGDPTLVRYGATCSAGTNNTLTVAVKAIYLTDGSELAAGALPPAQTKTGLTCTRGAVRPVSFEFSAIAPSNQGFLDIGVGTDLIHCSAKLDCKKSPDDLSFFPAGTAEGLVLGLVCTAPGGSTATVLHMDDVKIACASNTITINPDYDGAVPQGAISGSWANQVAGAVVSRGGSPANRYWNVVVGLKSGVASASCTMTASATATAGGELRANGAYIGFNVAVGNTCVNKKLFDDGQITSEWPETNATKTFLYRFPAAPRVFVTSGLYTPGVAYGKGSAATRFASTADADKICAARASVGGLPGTYKAWLGSSSETAVARTNAGALRRTDGVTVSYSGTDLLHGSLAAPIDRDEGGVQVPGGSVWTAAKTDGGSSGAHCNDWTSTSSGVTATVGSPAASDGAWTNNGQLGCQAGARFYCVEVP